jgi:hypothetical protein
LAKTSGQLVEGLPFGIVPVAGIESVVDFEPAACFDCYEQQELAWLLGPTLTQGHVSDLYLQNDWSGP